MNGRLRGVRALVTGASRGLGRAVAGAFLVEGATVIGTARHPDPAGPGWPAGVHPVALDLADPARVDAAAQAALAVHGGLDVVVNNAGLLGIRAPLAGYPPDLWDELMAVNVTGTLRLTQRLLPGLADGGAIINVTSGAAGRAGWGGYSITKLALNAITTMLREELAPRRIRCVAINPGPARTEMRAAAYPEEDPATVPAPEELVEPFVAVAAGADPGPLIQAAEWRR